MPIHLLISLIAGSIITLLGVWVGNRLASGTSLMPSFRGLFKPSPPEEDEIRYPTIMSARDMEREDGVKRAGVMMSPPEETPIKPPEETDIYPA